MVPFDHPAQQIVLQDYIHCVEDAEGRRDRLTRQELLPSWSITPVVVALQAMCGVALVAAVTVVAEVDDFRRFANARQLTANFGLVSSRGSLREHDPSRWHHRGRQRAGAARADRRAWAYRMTARVSRKLHDRLEPLSVAVRDCASTTLPRRHNFTGPTSASIDLEIEKEPRFGQRISEGTGSRSVRQRSTSREHSPVRQ
jgi:transposase